VQLKKSFVRQLFGAPAIAEHAAEDRDQPSPHYS
jgi:hypothetical protein